MVLESILLAVFSPLFTSHCFLSKWRRYTVRSCGTMPPFTKSPCTIPLVLISLPAALSVEKLHPAWPKPIKTIKPIKPIEQNPSKIKAIGLSKPLKPAVGDR